MTDSADRDPHDATSRASGVQPGLATTPETPGASGTDTRSGNSGIGPAVPLRSLDHLILQDRLGKGGMGVVDRAYDPILNRTVALKRINDGVLAEPQQVARFYREACSAAQLQHPNIVPIHDLGLFRGEYAFTMALVTGGTLAQHADRYRDPRKAAEVLEKVARAVQVAHERGIIHRDLKLANVFLDERDEPLVGDFGLAKMLEPGVELTQNGTMMGTPAYMAPEQFPGSRTKMSCRTDIWALGIMLHELLSGERPFNGSSWEEIADKVTRGKRPTLTEPAGLAQIVSMCLQRNPAHRYPTAAALADDLARWLIGDPVQTTRPARNRRIGWAIAAMVFLLTGGLLTATLSGAFTPKPKEPKLPEPIVLIGPSGMPLVRYEPIGDQAPRTQLEGDRHWFTVYVQKQTVLVFDSSPWSDYRIEAEVFRPLDTENDEAGIVFGRVRDFFPEGICESYVTLGCRRSGGVPQVSLALQSRLAANVKDANSLIPFGVSPHDKPPTSGWLPMAVEIRPTGFRAEYASKGGIETFTRILPEFVKNNSGLLVPNHKDWSRPFHPGQGIGLYLTAPKASFRNVVLRPLKPQ